MMNNNLTLEWSLDAGRRRKTEATPMPMPVGKLPRVARLMALAIKFDGMIRAGAVTDYADLARLGLVTRARMTQIMNLLNLAPDIQEQIMFLPERTQGRETIAERNLRPLVRVVLWGRQRKLWRSIATSQ
ncbi:MAG: hypothetical protein NTW28_24955 [Candidatus Solibacter sp.]|nr:hypothetical protein [Candidatus Solibacter sp.]